MTRDGIPQEAAGKRAEELRRRLAELLEMQDKQALSVLADIYQQLRRPHEMAQQDTQTGKPNNDTQASPTPQEQQAQAERRALERAIARRYSEAGGALTSLLNSESLERYETRWADFQKTILLCFEEIHMFRELRHLRDQQNAKEARPPEDSDPISE